MAGTRTTPRASRSASRAGTPASAGGAAPGTPADPVTQAANQILAIFRAAFPAAAVPPAAPAPAPAAPAASAPRFTLNPYDGEVNPATSEGLKLYLKAIQGFDKDSDRVNVGQSNSREVLQLMKDQASKFGWAEIVAKIPVAGGSDLNLLKSSMNITLDEVKTAAYQIWGPGNGDPCPTVLTIDAIDPSADPSHRPRFDKRVKSEMIAKGIQGVITKEAYAELLLDKEHFEWSSPDTTKIDGLTLLWFLLKKINPTTQVGVSNLKDSIERATLAHHGHDVVKLLAHMKANYTEIKERGGTHDDFLRHVFRALLTSKNSVFVSFIQRYKDEWETTGNTTTDDLTTIAVQKYNNMVADNQWQKGDPKDAVIAALTTKVEKLEKQATSGPAKAESKKQSSDGVVPGTDSLPAWRIVHNKGDKCTVDGTDYWWCPHHKKPGSWDGMYMPHNPNDGHEQWKARNEKRRGKRAAATSSSTDRHESKPKLQLSERLESALMADCSMSKEDIQKMVDGYNQEN